MAKRKRLPTTVQYWWPVRWGTKHEWDDAFWLTLFGERLAEEFARALDLQGWMIVARPQRGGFPPNGQYQMDSNFGPVPEWARDINPKAKPKLAVIDGGKNDEDS